MMAVKKLMRLLVTTLFTGVMAGGDSVFVYTSVGDDVLLPCANGINAHCSSTTWTYYKSGAVRFTQEIIRGKVREDSDKASRLSLGSDCSLHIRDLMAEDAGSYFCETHHTGNGLKHGNGTNVYLSLLSISSPTPITNMKPGGKLILSCILFTYYDAGSCKLYTSSGVKLNWVAEDGAELPKDSRYEIIDRCNITLTITLQKGDNNRKWRCLLNNSTGNKVMFLDFRSMFVLERPSSDLILFSSTTKPDVVQLPISRIALCAALPVMVMVVAFFTWRGDRKRAKVSTTGMELQEMN